MIKKIYATIFRNSAVYLLATFLLALTLSACGPVTPIATVTPTPAAALPDLTITSAYVSMVDNNGRCLGYYGFNVTILNQGNAPAPDVFIAETNTGQQVGIGTLDAHQSISMPFVAKSASGAYTVVADPQNAIMESNESNNSATYAESTATAPATCPQTLSWDATPTPVPFSLPTFAPGGFNATPTPVLPLTPAAQSLAGLIYADMNLAQICEVTPYGGSTQILNRTSAQFSKNGLQAIFESGGDLFLAEPMDNPGINITNTPERLDISPRWWLEANPQKIVFNSAPSDNIVAPHVFFLSMVNLDGSGYEILASKPSYTPPAPNPSGQNIAYEEYGKPMNYVIGAGAYSFDPSEFGYQPSKDAIFSSPSWSPDGHWLSWWVSDKLDAPKKYELVLFDHTGAGGHRILHTYAPLPGTCCGLPNPVWSPDGNWIAFQTRGEMTLADLWISRPDGSDAYRLGLATNPVWNPDSQHLAYVQQLANVDPDLVASISVLEIKSWTTFSSSLPAGSIPLAWRKK
jgi:hypothetical protein